MPMQGVDARIEVYPEYADALDGIEHNSHIFVLCWMHEADRTACKAAPRKISPELPAKGVFSLRSPVRPNPISLSVVGLVQVCGKRFLDVTYLDMIDGTPVLDIKPYQARWDCVFSAVTGDRTEKIGLLGPALYQESLIREAVGYHGECCPGVAVAVRIAMAATRILGGDLRRGSIRLVPGPDPCINDALIGITGARFGNRRLVLPHRPPAVEIPGYTLCNRDTTLVFHVNMPLHTGDICRIPDTELFSVTVR
jgi:tRNA-Thr(GGU) m(6)t(6)A37 methyltransferase TsaA